jgi:putative transposase
MRTVQTTYRYRIEPTTAHEAELRRFAGARRWGWNWALARKKAHYEATKQTLRTRDLEAELVVLKRQSETVWLAAIDSQVLQQVLCDLDQAFRSFFAKRARFPRFKSRKIRSGVSIRRAACVGRVALATTPSRLLIEPGRVPVVQPMTAI